MKAPWHHTWNMYVSGLFISIIMLNWYSPGAKGHLITFSRPKGLNIVSIVEFSAESESLLLANRTSAQVLLFYIFSDPPAAQKAVRFRGRNQTVPSHIRVLLYGNNN
jgi:hypothetical protein